MGATAMRAEGLTKRYGDVAALDHLDLEVVPGEVLGYLGPGPPLGTGHVGLPSHVLGARRATTLGSKRHHDRRWHRKRARRRHRVYPAGLARRMTPASQINPSW